jgi:hypothetical protein
MDLFKELLPVLIGLLGLLRGDLKTMGLKDKIILPFIIILTSVGGYFIYQSETNKQDKIQNDKIKLEKEISDVCKDIYSIFSYWDKYGDIKSRAFLEEASVNHLEQDMNKFIRIKSDNKTIITQGTLFKIEKIINDLANFKYLTSNDNLVRILWSDICSIDTSYKAMTPFWELMKKHH